MDNVKDLATEIKTSFEDKLTSVNAELADIKQKMAALGNPRGNTSPKSDAYAKIYDELKAKNAVTVNGTGNIEVVQDLWTALLAKSDLLSAFSLFTSPSAQTNIPVWGTPLAESTGADENATITADTAGPSAATLVPKQYGKILPCSWESLMFSAANLESKFPELFRKSFSVDLLKQALNGDGTGNNMTGLFLDTAITNKLTTGTSGSAKIADLVELALTVSDFSDSAGIIMNPSVYSLIMGDTTAELQVYKEEMARQRTIEGVKIYLTSIAPKTLTGGSVIAVAGDLASYALGIAGEMVIKQVEDSTSLKTIVKAGIWANGKPVVPANFYQMKTKA